MALSNSRSGKCSNFGNCSLADASQTIEVPPGLDFVCTECGKSILLTEANNTGSNSKTLIVAGLLLLAVLAAGGIAWSWFSGNRHAVAPDSPMRQESPPPPRSGAGNKSRRRAATAEVW